MNSRDPKEVLFVLRASADVIQHESPLPYHLHGAGTLVEKPAMLSGQAFQVVDHRANPARDFVLRLGVTQRSAVVSDWIVLHICRLALEFSDPVAKKQWSRNNSKREV